MGLIVTSRRPHDPDTIQAQLLELLVRSIDKSKKPKSQAAKPKTYKGDPEDLERDIHSLENVWPIEKHKYKNDLYQSLRSVIHHVSSVDNTQACCQNLSAVACEIVGLQDNQRLNHS